MPHPDIQHYLINAIEQYTTKVAGVKLLLSYSENHRNPNFNKLSNIPNILLVVRTQANVFVAGFSEAPINVSAAATNKSLLLALNTRRTYRLLGGKQVVKTVQTESSTCLIFGNS